MRNLKRILEFNLKMIVKRLLQNLLDMFNMFLRTSGSTAEINSMHEDIRSIIYIRSIICTYSPLTAESHEASHGGKTN